MRDIFDRMDTIFKRFRDSLNWSQKRLADELGVGQSTVGNYESGFRTPEIAVARRFVTLANGNGFSCSLDDCYPAEAHAAT